jgi:hypothetical protein
MSNPTDEEARRREAEVAAMRQILMQLQQPKREFKFGRR